MTAHKATIPVLASLLIAGNAQSQAVPNCKGWNTERFFESATDESVLACVELGVDIRTAGGNRSRTPLHRAVWKSLEVVQALLAAGAGLNDRDKFGATPLHLAASGENPEVIEALRAAGADIEARAKDHQTPLHRAAGWARFSPVQR